jgi:hypothetical protein
MSLKNTIEQFRWKQVEKGCPYANFLELLAQENKEDAKSLEEAVNKGIPATTICKALRAEGYRLAEISINEHRRGVCRCHNKK